MMFSNGLRIYSNANVVPIRNEYEFIG